MVYGKALMWVMLLVQMAACSWQPLSGHRDEIEKPRNDARQYRYHELDNGLQVLLVSDPGADKAAASLDVNIGSRQDPRDYQGLAHFLEHMLFLGTEKYPQAGEYQSFITGNGGSHNAFTSFEHTNYFFDISADALAPALDRFAQFFVAPLFNAEYVQREVNAVNSEYRARIRDDRRRELAVFKAEINKAHPFSKFSVGNLKTLQSQEPNALRQQLLDFYQANYSAALMSLTVIGKQSLDELEDIVLPRFAPVENRQRQLQPIDTPLFETGQLPRWLRVEPVQNRRALAVSFPVPDPKPHWRTKPLDYIANILGHEGEGSLLSLLKDRGWAESLSAGRSLEYQGGALFGVEIALTEAGLDHSDEIVALLFDNIRLLREQGVEAWRFKEQATLSRQQFLFRATPSAINEVVQLAMALQDYPAAEVLRGPHLMADYDPAVIDHFLRALRPENSFVMQVAPGLDTAREVSRYKVNYGHRKLSSATLANWSRASSPPELALPAINPFVSEDFSLVTAQAETSHPQRLDPVDKVELWLHSDDEFELPKGRVYLLLQTPRAGNTVAQQAKTDLWLRMVRDQLNEGAYPAQLAGLSFDLSADWRGIQVSVGGFSQKQPELLAQVLATLSNTEWLQPRFERIKAQRLRQFENARKGSPYQQVLAELPRSLRIDQAPLERLTVQTRDTSLQAVADHADKVLAALQPRMLLVGNYDRGDARNMAGVAGEALRVAELPRPQQPQQQIVQLPVGQHHWQIDAQHDDAAIALYLQSADSGSAARVAMGLAAQIISADFYHQLRTQKQLGYVVSASVYPQREVAGLIFLVQSPVAGPRQLQQEIDDYLKSWRASGVSREDFQRHKQTLIKRLGEQPDNLWEAADRYWQDLLEGYPNFDSREQLVAALEGMSYEQWWQRLAADTAADQSRRLYLYNRGKWPDQQPRGEAIKALQSFKEALPVRRFN